MRPSHQATALETALAWAKRSTCLRRQVGCVLLTEYWRVLSTGYNGVAVGQPHCNQAASEDAWIHNTPFYPHACPGAAARSGERLDDCAAIHAEQNALVWCREPDKIAYAVVTTAPCVSCVKLLLSTPCHTIYYRDEYADSEKAKALWLRRGSGSRWVRLTTP